MITRYQVARLSTHAARVHGRLRRGGRAAWRSARSSTGRAGRHGRAAEGAGRTGADGGSELPVVLLVGRDVGLLLQDVGLVRLAVADRAAARSPDSPGRAASCCSSASASGTPSLPGPATAPARPIAVPSTRFSCSARSASFQQCRDRSRRPPSVNRSGRSPSCPSGRPVRQACWCCRGRRRDHPASARHNRPPMEASSEYEFAPLRIPPGTSRSAAATMLSLQSDVGGWELARLQLHADGTRKVILRRRSRGSPTCPARTSRRRLTQPGPAASARGAAPRGERRPGITKGRSTCGPVRNRHGAGPHRGRRPPAGRRRAGRPPEVDVAQVGADQVAPPGGTRPAGPRARRSRPMRSAPRRSAAGRPREPLLTRCSSDPPRAGERRRRARAAPRRCRGQRSVRSRAARRRRAAAPRRARSRLGEVPESPAAAASTGRTANIAPASRATPARPTGEGLLDDPLAGAEAVEDRAAGVPRRAAARGCRTGSRPQVRARLARRLVDREVGGGGERRGHAAQPGAAAAVGRQALPRRDDREREGRHDRPSLGGAAPGQGTSTTLPTVPRVAQPGQGLGRLVQRQHVADQRVDQALVGPAVRAPRGPAGTSAGSCLR